MIPRSTPRRKPCHPRISLAAAAPARLPTVLWPLLFGNFVIGSGVMVVPGTLNEISSDLSISVAAAGQLISTAALLMCIGAPTLAAVVAGWDRRPMLTLSTVWMGLMHFTCMAASNVAILLPLRVLAMVSPAIFTPQAAACVGLLVPAEQRGRAITFVFLGWLVASVWACRWAGSSAALWAGVARSRSLA